MSRKPKRVRHHDRHKTTSTYLGNVALQMDRVEDGCRMINAAALVQHMKLGKPQETFAAPINIAEARDRCARRIAKHYGLNNKYGGPKP